MSRRLTILALAVGLIAGACSSGPSQDEFDAEVARVQAAENRIAQLESQLAGTEDRLSDAVKDLATTSADLEGTSSDLAAAVATAEGLATAVERLEGEQTDLTAELATANGDLAEATSDLAEATGDRDNVQTALNAAETERDELRVTATDLQAALDALALQGARSLLAGQAFTVVIPQGDAILQFTADVPDGVRIDSTGIEQDSIRTVLAGSGWARLAVDIDVDSPFTFERFLDDIVRNTFGDAEVVSDDPAIVAGFPAQRISIEDADRETHQEHLLIDVPGAIVHITAFSSTGNWPAQEVAFDAFLETIAIG